jgi:RNA polymerase sigma-70 factor (TIGR02943 family)
MLLTNQYVNPHKWVENYADYLYAYAITRLNDEEQARDLVQETFLAALERVDKFEGKSSERTWLTAILKNKIIDVYRQRSSGLINYDLGGAGREQEDFFENEGHWAKKHSPTEFGVEDHDPMHNKEFNRVLQNCMQKLPALWMAVFSMKHMDDEATDTICAELKVSAANFWVIIHRAKLNLRACLQKNWI